MTRKHNPNPGYPLHRFNRGQTIAWLRFPNMRKFMANKLAKEYPKTGVGILSATLRLFVKVAPNGTYFELPPPHTSYEMWQVANAPRPATECVCRTFIDLEAGTWGARGPSAGHHPHCQFRETAIEGFQLDAARAVNRLETRLGPNWEHRIKESGISPQERPDEWIRTMKELQNK